MPTSFKIAVFISYLNEPFQLTLFKGIKKRVDELGGDLTSIQVDNTSDESLIVPQNILLDLPRYVAYDGILLLATLSNFKTSLPCVSIGGIHPLASSLLINSKASMEKLMDHLINHHGYRRFLFLSGPKNHQDNIIREAAFLESIEKNKAFFPELNSQILRADFKEETAFEVMREEMETNIKSPYDVIVAANDYMAMGVIKALRINDIESWNHCAVTGFDDIPQAALEVPSLTSVGLPLMEMGAFSVDILLKKIQGEDTSFYYSINSELVIRESCGCNIPEIDTKDNSHRLLLEESKQKINRIKRQFLESEFRLKLVSDLGQKLIEASNMEKIITGLKTYLDQMKVKSFYIFLYPTDWKNYKKLPKELFLLFSYDEEGAKSFPSPGYKISYDELVNFEKLKPKRHKNFHHLHTLEEQIGFVIYDVEDNLHTYIGTMALHLANSIKRIHVLEEKSDRATQLEAEVNKRTKDLQTSNNHLEEEIIRRIAVESELRKSRQTLEGILESMPVPILIYLTPDGTILYTNKAFQELLPYPLINLSLMNFFPPLSSPEKLMESTLFFPKKKKKIPVLVHSAPIKYKDKNCLISGLIDLSKQKSLESDILKISEYERERFGLDLHDDICQRLAGISMYSNVIAQQNEGDEKLRSSLQELSEMLDETLQKTRMYAHASFPVELQNLGLDTVLKELCATTEKQIGGICEYSSQLNSFPYLFTPEQQINIYRIVQEGLANATKHGKAKKIELRINLSPSMCTLQILSQQNKLRTENKVLQTISHGLGLRSMQYRASQLGGQLTISAFDKSSFELKLLIPISLKTNFKKL